MSLSPEQQFLRDLTKLSKKHGLYIGGCGCNESPYVYDDHGSVVVEELTHLLDAEGGQLDRYVGRASGTDKLIK